MNKIVKTKKKILIVDDDENIRYLLKEIFQQDGYLVDETSDGQKGFEKACLNTYDLITIDIRMPNWDGIEAILGLILVKNELKFLVISGYISEEHRLHLVTIDNVIGIIDKPFDTNHLLKLVKESI